MQSVWSLARTQGVSEEMWRWWLQQEPTHIDIDVEGYVLRLNSNRTLELAPLSPEAMSRHQGDSAYNGFSNLPHNAVLVFGGRAVLELTLDLLAALDDPQRPVDH